MFKFYDSLLNKEGQPIVGASVSVFAAGTNTLAQLYNDDQATLKTNPLTTDSAGYVECKASNGKYDIQYLTLADGILKRINGEIFDDPSEAGNAGIALGMPGEFTVAGSPGNSITVTKKNQTANTIYAGPTSGVAAPPAFRGIVSEDMPQATSSARGAVPLAAAADLVAKSSTAVLTPATSDWIKVASYTVGSSVASIPFNNVFNGTYSEYIVEFNDLHLSGSAVGFGFQLGTTSGGTTAYLTAANYYTSGTLQDSNTTNGSAQNVTAIRANAIAQLNDTRGITNSASGAVGINGFVRFPNYNNSATRQKDGLFGISYGISGTTDHVHYNGGWFLSTGTNYDSVQFLPTSGNITIGSFTIFGRNK